jgi:hypothetical protein
MLPEVLQFHSARIQASHLSRASLEKGLLVGHFPLPGVISCLGARKAPKAGLAGKSAGNGAGYSLAWSTVNGYLRLLRRIPRPQTPL